MDHHAKPTALDFAELDQLIHDGQCHIDGHCKADPDIASAIRRDNGRVDTNEISIEGDQRSAGVSRVDRGVGLDEVFIAFGIDPRPSKRRDDAACHGLAKTERITDRHNEIPHEKGFGIAEWDFCQVIRVDP